MTFDIETFLSELETYLKANLNTKITAINTEKGDSPQLASINSDAYFLMTMDEAVANYDPFVYYGIQDIVSDGIGPGTAKAYTVVVALLFADSASDQLNGKRVLRYSRALNEVIDEKYAEISYSVKTKVKSLVPISLSLIDTTNNYRAVGVEIEVTIA